MADFRPAGWSDEQVGMAIRQAAMSRLSALGDLIERVQKSARSRGYVVGIDGRRIFVRSAHSSVNALFQSAGAIVMKVALCYLDNWIKEEKLDAKFVGNFHDEWQIEVLQDHAERVKELAALSIKTAGEFFKLNCPLEGDAKIGLNWAETH